MKKQFISHEEFKKFPNGLIDWEERKNKKVVVDEEGYHLEPFAPIYWSDLIAYAVCAIVLMYFIGSLIWK